ncbi:hypothetical protein G6F62_014768 [Rhizopus arrhizus]|nr:hypothetical protein G6F62_014768 [Rhizopus arrhizus]
MAGAVLARCDLAQQRPFRLAARHGVWATRVERATSGRVQGRRQFALDRLVVAPPRRQRRQFFQQRLRVGMVGALEHGIGGRKLHHAAQIHDGHAVRDVADHAQVMAEEEIRQVQLVAQLFEEI